MPNYLFDVTVIASLRLDAPDEATARAWLRDIQCGTGNFGALPTGEPLVGEVSIDGPLDLVEVDGEPQDGATMFHAVYERERYDSASDAKSRS